MNGTMPREGFRSITVSQAVYDRFYKRYQTHKKDLELKGISSFTGYITSILEELMMKEEIFARYAPFIQEFGVQGDTVILWDNKVNRSVEVVLKDKELYCRFDERSDCVHVGYAYSIPQVYSIMAELGIKPPKIRE